MAEITITGALVYKGVAEEIISNKNGKKYTKGTFVLECQEKYTSRVSFDAFDSMYTHAINQTKFVYYYHWRP